MTSKYDRSIEEIERGRSEEGRMWFQRNPENVAGQQQYGIGAVSGYGEPFWAAQLRSSSPFVTPQYGSPLPPYNPYGVPGGFQPQLAFQQPGSFQGSPFPLTGVSHQAAIPVQFQPQPPLTPSFTQNPYLQQINPTLPAMTHHYGFQQAYPFLQGPMHFEPQWPGQYPVWENIAQRGMNMRQPSRAFYRPPRAYKRSDELIRDEICKRLALTAEIDVTDVEVIVKDGEVTLKGVVDDRVAKRIVEDITETTFGVRDVLNDLKIGSRLAEQELYATTRGKEK